MKRRSSQPCCFTRNKDGAVAIIFAIIAVPLLLAVGASIDFVRAYNDRTNLQLAADSAVLAAASRYSKDLPEATTARTINAFLAANEAGKSAVVGPPQLSSDKSELCIDVTDSIPTSFMKLAHIDEVPVRVRSCANLPGVKEVEIG